MKKFLLSSLAIAACMSAIAAAPDALYILGNIQGNDWNPAESPAFTKTSDGVFEISDITLTGSPAYFTFTNIQTSDWDELNDGTHRYGPTESGSAFDTKGTEIKVGGDVSWTLPAGTYSFTVNFNTMMATATGEEAEPVEPGPVESDVIYLIGDMEGWNINGEDYPLPMISDGVYEAIFTFGALTDQYFRFYTELGNWDANSYGPLPNDNTNIEVEFTDNIFESDMVSGKGSWKITSFDGGAIRFTVDFNKMSVEFGIGNEAVAAINAIGSDVKGEDVIYNLNGIRVNHDNLTPGIYVINGKKVAVK